MGSVPAEATSTTSPSAGGVPTARTPLSEQQLRREQERIDFYRTYDVMTGVRIAATLGGFFGLMVILVLYKSKSKTEKVCYYK